MQNSEEWNLDFYLMDLADEIARHTFNTGRYPEINYITGNAGPDTPTTTNQDGVLNVYIPQNIDQQQFQQALNEYIKNGCDVIYQESQCRIQVVQCPSTKEDAQKEIQAFNAAPGTAYYRLINGPNNSLYIMKCEAQTKEIKDQIQQQFENSNGYYYSQTNTYTPNSYESNSKESKYITALKLFYFADIMPEKLPQPDQDDEEQKKLYNACQIAMANPGIFYGMMGSMLNNEQTDRDNEVKNYGISLTDPATIQQYTLQYQSVVPMMVPAAQMSQVPPVQVPEQSLEIYDPESGLKSTSAVSPYGNPIYQQFPVPAQVINPTIPKPVTTPENNNQMNNQLKLYISNIGDGRYCGSFSTTNGRMQPLVFDQLSFNIKRQQNCTYDVEVMLYLNGKSLQERVALFKGISSAPGGDNEHRNLMISVKGKMTYLPISINGGKRDLSTDELNKLVPNINNDINLGGNFDDSMGFRNIIYNSQQMTANNSNSKYNPNAIIEQTKITKKI